MNRGNITHPSTQVAAKNSRFKNVVMAFTAIRFPLHDGGYSDHRVCGARDPVLDRNPEDENLNMSHSNGAAALDDRRRRGRSERAGGYEALVAAVPGAAGAL